MLNNKSSQIQNLAQLVEKLLETQDVQSLNPIHLNIYLNFFDNQLHGIEKTNLRKKATNDPLQCSLGRFRTLAYKQWSPFTGRRLKLITAQGVVRCGILV